MLGITTADAIAVGTLIIAVLAAWRGGKAGDEAKKATPPPATTLSLGMASFADTGAMMQLTAAIEKLTVTIVHGIEANEQSRKDAVTDHLENLARKIDEIGRHKEGRGR